MNLVLVDTTGIQPYIFGSNRLRENIGASYLVAQATGSWALGAVPKPNNVVDADTAELDDGITIEGTPDLQAEVLYAGGGNVAVLARDESSAGEFIYWLSRRVLASAPGLTLAFGVAAFDWNRTGSLVQAMHAARADLDREKRAGPESAPLLGLGVTLECRSTGLPAVGVTRPYRTGLPGYPASAEILAKDAVYGEAKDALEDAVPPGAPYVYPGQLDELGRTVQESSYVAVVHADGNGIGSRIGDLERQDNRAYIAELRRFSQSLTNASIQALRATMSDLHRGILGDRIPGPDAGGVIADLVLAEDEHHNILLPFRPLVFGGDDVTFVSDGRLGLSLALSYLRHFEEQTGRVDLPGGKATASAGVGIVKAHYPFSRAYALASELTHNAKDYSRELSRRGVPAPATIDWHVAETGLAGSIGEIRRREYSASRNGHLEQRPVRLDAPSELRSWDAVESGIVAFQGRAASPDSPRGWLRGRNKVKRLREALRERESAVRTFRALYHQNALLPTITGGGQDTRGDGWRGDRCAYFDAIEIADLYIPLPPPAEELS